jgi:hypothetical protein
MRIVTRLMPLGAASFFLATAILLSRRKVAARRDWGQSEIGGVTCRH